MSNKRYTEDQSLAMKLRNQLNWPFVWRKSSYVILSIFCIFHRWTHQCERNYNKNGLEGEAITLHCGLVSRIFAYHLQVFYKPCHSKQKRPRWRGRDVSRTSIVWNTPLSAGREVEPLTKFSKSGAWKDLRGEFAGKEEMTFFRGWWVVHNKFINKNVFAITTNLNWEF